MPKRKIGRTKSGKRALKNARKGQDTPRAIGGSIRSGSYTISVGKKKKKLQTIIVPHVVKQHGGISRLPGGQYAESRALQTGDYTKVGRPRKPGSPKIAKDIDKATRMSKKFSDKLGRAAAKRDRKRRRK